MMSDENIFELGLVMAGAISAGAYTAGVMDFLIEALDAFEAAKKTDDWDGPTHTVRVPLMAGASAGGMTSAMAAVQVFHEMEHVRTNAAPPPAEKNRLYANWVQRIDLNGLLETRDLDGDGYKAGVRSGLCCNVLDDIVNETFQQSGPKIRAWLGRPGDPGLRVLVTLTNLRGVPYSFKIEGAETLPYATLNHGDYLDFKIGDAPPPTSGTAALDIKDTTSKGWDMFRAAALATGAFPVGLAPRQLSKPVVDYDVSLRVGRDTDVGFQTIKPNEIIRPADPYAFVSVDGGTIDNEPLEIGRRLLCPNGSLDDNGETARQAIVLIAPFPSFIEFPKEQLSLRLIDVLPQLSTTLIQQSRFKPDELDKAANAAFFSRFLISPERDGNGSQEAKDYPIASGVMHGFGGFIDESFRRQDFLLGRRNAQAFLRFHFALPETHKMFDGVKDRQKWHVRQPDGDDGAAKAHKRFAPKTTAAADKLGLPIIPLCAGLDKEIVIGVEDLPKPSRVDQHALATLIHARAHKVVETLVDHDLVGLTGGLFGGVGRLAAKT